MTLSTPEKLSGAFISAIAGLAIALPAEAVTFQLNWEGQTLGYSAQGSFSYDELAVPTDGIVRSNDLDDFDISFFTPEQVLMESFFDNNLTTPGFNFNFDTTTGEILQSGRWDTPEGINVGGIRGEELNFFSAPNPKADLFDGEGPNPHVHLTDWGEDYPELPLGLTRGARPHLDIAFFTRTRAEVLADPDAGSALGQKLVATQVPEPTALLGLGMFALAAMRRPKR